MKTKQNNNHTMERKQNMGHSISTEMAICIVLFNPAKSKRIIENYYKMISHLKKYKVYTLELVYDGRQKEIPPQSGVHHAYCKSVMFHKENLCRILETKVSSKYKKIAFIDADLIWDPDSNWYEKALVALDTHDIVQLFDKAIWQNASEQAYMERQSVAKMKSEIYDSSFHPGFAWGFRREWYKKAGFFDLAVTGSGDTLSVIKWMGKQTSPTFKSIPLPSVQAYTEFLPGAPKLTCLRNVTVRHLHHGSRKNRQYVERHSLLDTNTDIRKLVHKNVWGVYEWKDPKWSKIMLDYFISRHDDDDGDETVNNMTS
jgi:hypothetical protein